MAQILMLDYNSPIFILKWLLDTLEDQEIRRCHLLREMHGLWRDANQLQYQSVRPEWFLVKSMKLIKSEFVMLHLIKNRF